jgi:hypothetical protein
MLPYKKLVMQNFRIVDSSLFSSSSDSYHTLQSYGLSNLQDHGNNDSAVINTMVLSICKTMLPTGSLLTKGQAEI